MYYLLFLSDMTLEASRKTFEKYSNTKFCENLYIWNRVIPCGHTNGHRDRRMWWFLTVAFCNFSNMKKQITGTTTYVNIQLESNKRNFHSNLGPNFDFS